MRRRVVNERVKELRAKYHANPLGKYSVCTPGLYHIWSPIVSRFNTIKDAVGYSREFGYKEFRVIHYEPIDNHTVNEIIDFREE